MKFLPSKGGVSTSRIDLPLTRPRLISRICLPFSGAFAALREGRGGPVYCSKCGGAMPDGAAFCSQCGESFSIAIAVPRNPMVATSAAAPISGGVAAIPAYTLAPAMPRVEYAGFWLRFLALLIDNVVMGIGFVVVLIPLIFLTGLGSLLSRIHPDQKLDDTGIFF